ncbi:23S rRNA (guanine(745)-N(1))-methyltransferase [bioreactor metagenome]|uniref:23S rRNA (Guanine(745)-N(1))-methyltransferase n=1 Tax=bioreactor metagenome TaxID=1076179 RepID=A0A644WR70_9ZZZZ
MSRFICPVCGKDLLEDGQSLRCENAHSFDIARSGYVNLLLSQQVKSKHHGDDKMMVRARRDFLNKGYYRPLLDSLSEAVRKHVKDGCVIFDAGCGECWYTANIYEYLAENQIEFEMLAVDISKDALTVGAKRCRLLKLAVASVFRLPMKDGSCDILTSVFAPCCETEFARVLKKGGILIRAVPLKRHLWSLKKAVYDNPYENQAEDFVLDRFELIGKQEITKTIHLSSGEDITNVFMMTPYYYKTSAEDQNKLRNLTELNTEIEFGILIYRRN